LIRQASEMGHLYGSVRSADIAQGLSDAGFQVSRAQVQIDVPIKFLGMHQVRVLLHPEVSLIVNVNVAQSEEEAAVQAAAKAKADAAPAPVTAEIVFGADEAPAKASSPKKKAAAPKKAKAKAEGDAHIEDAEDADAPVGDLLVDDAELTS
jgi:large subunit ribosomal protein L9